MRRVKKPAATALWEFINIKKWVMPTFLRYIYMKRASKGFPKATA